MLLNCMNSFAILVLEPSEPVNLDLSACERNEDVNFIFSGFELYGQVLKRLMFR